MKGQDALREYAGEVERLKAAGRFPEPLLPVDVQLREDAAFGAAWRRCKAALPDGYTFGVTSTRGVRSGPYVATTDFGSPMTGFFYGPSPTAALESLAERLEGEELTRG